jgi:hypothetical protein
MGESLVGATPKGNSELKNCRGNPLWLPKIMGRHGGLPLQRISNCGLRNANCGIEKIGYLHISQFAFRLSQFLLVFAQNHGQAR